MQKMGFDLLRVVSDDKHYGAFICKLCNSLVSLDAVVTTPCSHPFCRECLSKWVQRELRDHRKPCRCPTCNQDLAAISSITTPPLFQIEDASIMVQPLGEAQPLALEVLKLIQVACTGRVGHDANGCGWRGDYGSLQNHCDAQHHGEDFGATRITENTSKVSRRGLLDKKQYARSLSMPSLFGNNNRKESSGQQHADDSGEIQGPVDLPNNNRLQNVREQSEDVHLDARPNKVSPSVAQTKLQRGLSTRLTPKQNGHQQRNMMREIKRRYKSVSDLGKALEESTRENDVELELSCGEMDWNLSVNSMGFNNTQSSPPKKEFAVASVDEEKSQELALSLGDDTRSGSGRAMDGDGSAQAIERSEKLKKQANAKFNKGDFEGSRALYSEGLNIMTNIITISKEECELVATLFSNRAVTYFREKNFKKCIEDCEKALEYLPTFEKSYIRKWRAFMALGNFEEACECLEEAHKQIPSSQRVYQELVKAREQAEVLSVVNTMIDGGNLEKAKETMKPLAKESDNIGLLLVAAMADAGLGLTEAALDKVNKALRFNPSHAEALQLRGLVLFLSGEMDKGIRLLQELHNRHPHSSEIANKLNQCQVSLAAFSKGRGYAKRGRYKDAVEQFTIAMEEKALPLPSGTALYSLIKIERAEALLLAKHYGQALKDCKDALESQPENVEAWALKAEIYMCLGRAADAKHELAEIRQTWGGDNLVIEDAYRKASFEEKVRRVDDELMQLINDVEAGVPEELVIDGRDGTRETKAGASGMHQSERRHGSSDRRAQMNASKRAKSYRNINKLSSNESDRKSQRNRKDKSERKRRERDRADKKSKRDRERVRTATGDGSGRISLGTQTSSRTLTTNATGMSSRTLKTHGTKDGKRSTARKNKSSRVLK